MAEFIPAKQPIPFGEGFLGVDQLAGAEQSDVEEITEAILQVGGKGQPSLQRIRAARIGQQGKIQIAVRAEIRGHRRAQQVGGEKIGILRKLLADLLDDWLG